MVFFALLCTVAGLDGDIDDARVALADTARGHRSRHLAGRGDHRAGTASDPDVCRSSIMRVERDTTWADSRQAIVNRLTEIGGQHLILVRYHSDHNVHHEWVYNGADLENASALLWARSWRPELDSQLLEHYPHRSTCGY